MELLPCNELIVKDSRVRRKFDETEEESLAMSIKDFGLLHAIVVEKDGITLVAGERRLKAIQLLFERNLTYEYNGKEVPSGAIPVVNLSELTVNKYKEAELEENIRRVNLTWQEKSHAVSELHNLRDIEAKERGDKPQTKKDTAEELVSLGGERSVEAIITDVSMDLIVSTFSDDLDVQNAKTRKEAFKIIQRKLDIKHKEALAREFAVSSTTTPHNLIQGDLFEELPKIDSETFNCIIADPPYGLGADKFHNQAAERHTYEDTPEISNAITVAIAKEGFRIATKLAHLYLFCDVNRFSLMKRLVSEEGWVVWNTPLVWFRGASSGIAPRPDHGPRRTYETILFANKGNKRVNALLPDCIVKFPHLREVVRAANKPVELYRHFISQSCLPGDMVIDPCCGSGPIFPAANVEKVIAWGIEYDRYGAGLAAERIRKMEDD